MKSYKIGRMTFIQQELTWKQDKMLVKFLGKLVPQTDPEQNIPEKAGQWHDLLTRHNGLETFWGMVLIPRKNLAYLFWRLGFTILWLLRLRGGPYRQVPMAKVTNSQQKQMFEDFFFFNKPVLSGLNEFVKAFSQGATAGSSQPKETITTSPRNPGKSETTSKP